MLLQTTKLIPRKAVPTSKVDDARTQRLILFLFRCCLSVRLNELILAYYVELNKEDGADYVSGAKQNYDNNVVSAQHLSTPMLNSVVFVAEFQADLLAGIVGPYQIPRGDIFDTPFHFLALSVHLSSAIFRSNLLFLEVTEASYLKRGNGTLRAINYEKNMGSVNSCAPTHFHVGFFSLRTVVKEATN